MTIRRRALCVATSVLIASCGRDAAPPAAPPPAAKIAGAVPESTLTTVTLSGEAQKRLGIETSPAEQRSVEGARSFGGEILPVGGAQTTVTAPVAGTLGLDTQPPAVGSRVTKGQVVLTLVPLAAAERDVRIEAERAVSEAVGRQEMTAKRAERARRLALDGSGSQRAGEEALAELAVADAALTAARNRLALAARGVSAAGAIRLEAPRAAVLQTLHAAPGQTVGAGAPLFDLVAMDTVWLKVSVYAGDVDALDLRASVEVVPLGAPSGTPALVAAPVAAPPTADPTSAGLDLFYGLSNANRMLRPGQRVSVRVPLRTADTRLVVPRAAVLFDAFGGAWLYEARDGGVFVRQRIELADFVGAHAVLLRGPAAGTRVVTTGAAELFGTEFGVGK